MNIKEKLEVLDKTNAANAQHIEEWDAKKITGVFIDVNNGIASRRTIDKSLTGYYELLGCRSIDIVARKIADKRFDIVCDDEALLKPSLLGAIDAAGHPMLYGPLFVVQFDGEDDVMSLTDDEIEFVLQHIVKVKFRCPHHERTAIALGECDYD